MPKLAVLFVLMTCFSFPCLAYSQNSEPMSLYGFTVSPYQEFRCDSLEFNLAGTPQGTNPNVLSEVKWKKLMIAVTGVEATLSLGEKDSDVLWLSTLNIGAGKILSGDQTDQDWIYDDRNGMFSTSESDAGDGRVLDVDLAFGPDIKVSRKVRLKPTFGITYHKQHLKAIEGWATQWGLPGYGGGSDPDTWPIVYDGPLTGNNSSYTAEWTTFKVGLAGSYKVSKKLLVDGGFGVHIGTYEGTGNWNLRTDLEHPASLKHEADRIRAGEVRAGIRWLQSDRLSFRFGIDHTSMSIENGKHAVYKVDGTRPSSRLNEVRWYSTGVKAEVSYSF